MMGPGTQGGTRDIGNSHSDNLYGGNSHCGS